MSDASQVPAAAEDTAQVTVATDIVEGEDRYIPLSKLVRSKRNVRKVGGMTNDQLKASIKALGLINPLIVVAGAKLGTFEVVAGGRRFEQLTELRREKEILKTYPVRCRIISADKAHEISLAENVVREAMHPADECEAFADLVISGKSAQDVADRFGLPLAHVEQRLKLGKLSPKLLQVYRDRQMTLEQAKALTLSDSHAEQEGAWFEADGYQREPHNIRSRLTTKHANASTDRRCKFVGVEAYEAAGGRVMRDLFAAHPGDGFWLDVPLLAELTGQKLSEAAEKIQAEGWGWVESRVEASYSELGKFRRVYPEQRPLTDEESAELDGLREEYDNFISSNDELTDEQTERLSVVENRIDQLENRESFWNPEIKASAGAMVSIGYHGALEVTHGLIRPGDVKPRQHDDGEDDADRQDDGEQEDTGRSFEKEAAAKTAGYSDALIVDLTAHRTAALRALLVDRPDIALVATVHNLMGRVFYQHTESALQLRVEPQSELSKLAPDIEQSKAHAVLTERRAEWEGKIPACQGDSWEWLLEQDQSTLMSLLAFCTAQTVNAVQVKHDFYGTARLVAANDLAAALSLHMANWWGATADAFLKRISKEQILDAVGEATDRVSALELAGLKKGPLAVEAERRLSGTGWLPRILRPLDDGEDATDQGGNAEVEGTADQGGTAEVEGTADQGGTAEVMRFLQAAE